VGGGLYELVSASELAAVLVQVTELSISGAEQRHVCVRSVWKVGIWEMTFYIVNHPKLSWLYHLGKFTSKYEIKSF